MKHKFGNLDVWESFVGWITLGSNKGSKPTNTGSPV